MIAYVFQKYPENLKIYIMLNLSSWFLIFTNDVVFGL